jgi:peroxiredoxin
MANDFRFQLLSDPDRSIGAAYGVARPPDDRYAGYAHRVTYVIDPDGVVRLAYAIAPSLIAGHPDRVLEDLRSLLSAAG